MKIVGAGLAGLLAGRMLSFRNPLVFERQTGLPNNHSAVLRFRTSAVGDVLNIPFKEVTMIKTHHPWKNAVADSMAYSFKNTGTLRSDRSIIAGATVATRWIAPPNLIPRMAQALTICYGEPFEFPKLRTSEPIISTVPMPVLMQELGYPFPVSFDHTPGLNIRATIVDCDAYISLLVPDPKYPFARISITGDELIVEIPSPTDWDGPSMAEFVSKCSYEACELLGFNGNKLFNISWSKQTYAKINPIDDAMRKQFMFWATDNFNIFSLGRFATWRPGLLLDDLVNDVRQISRWIDQGSYSIARAR